MIALYDLGCLFFLGCLFGASFPYTKPPLSGDQPAEKVVINSAQQEFHPPLTGVAMLPWIPMGLGALNASVGFIGTPTERCWY